MKCNICNTEFKENENSTVRQSWLDAGGFGQVPEFARVHPKCDEKEQNMITQGIIKLENLYKIKNK
ncbi:MAG TPA: hypothetical protein VMU29_10445 [Smithella sp.]|nr:hypothetical protein [Smithella sp.]